MKYRSETRVIIPRVTDFGRPPKTAYQALRQARDLLADENRWTTGEYFDDGDAEEVFEDRFCGSWQVCAMGALGLVTGEMPVSVTKQWSEFTDEELADWF